MRLLHASPEMQAIFIRRSHLPLRFADDSAAFVCKKKRDERQGRPLIRRAEKHPSNLNQIMLAEEVARDLAKLKHVVPARLAA